MWDEILTLDPFMKAVSDFPYSPYVITIAYTALIGGGPRDDGSKARLFLMDLDISS